MRNPLPLVRAALVAVVLLASAVPVRAQFVTRSTFAVTSTSVISLAIAAVPNGSMLIVYPDSDDFRHLRARRFAPSGGGFGDIQVDSVLAADEPEIAYDASRSQFVVAWREGVPTGPNSARPGIFTRRLDLSGAPIGKKRRVSADGVFANSPAIASLGTASIIFWYDFGLTAQRVDSMGLPLGAPLVLDPFGGQSSVIARRDGGYLLVYRTFDHQVLVAMRAYAPTNVQLASAVVSSAFDLSDAALALDDHTAAAAGVRQPDPEAPGVDVMVRRFTTDGTLLGGDILVHSAPTGATRPQVEFDVLGNLLVTWGERGGVWARALAADGTPLGPPVAVGSAPVDDYVITPGLHTVRLSGGSFASAWTDGTHAFANVVTLCTPGSATCGDGVYVPTCEACDDGAGNSDVQPDACRTNCRRAGCGDGVLDAGEACDDGNAASCDGCSATCALEVGSVCGDGVVSAGCEGCDDANTIAGDGCAPDCRLERIRGGGAAVTDCYAEWRVDNPANDPLGYAKGGMNPRQRCVDDDPRCDFDGGVPGGCTFRVAVCANDTDVPSCEPGERLLSWAVTKPTAAQAASRPALAAARDAFAGVPSEIVGPGIADLCSADALVPVPLRGTTGAYRPGKLTLGGRAELYDHRIDTDKLKLTCLPALP